LSNPESDVADVVGARTNDAAGHVQRQITQIVHVVGVVEAFLDRLCIGSDLALASEQKSPPGNTRCPVSRPCSASPAPARIWSAPRGVQALAQAYPDRKQGLLAQMAAGRIYLSGSIARGRVRCMSCSRLNRPASDWQATIDRGVEESKKALHHNPCPPRPSP